MFKVNNKGTRTTGIVVFIVNFEQVISGWEMKSNINEFPSVCRLFLIYKIQISAVISNIYIHKINHQVF